jgi:phosphatidylserine/phosphatidylglycerophosphate/cardiolipin synthase-like enzyme
LTGFKLAPAHNCMSVDMATRLSVIVDAEDYFRHARAAMLKARRHISLVGWDFDTRIGLHETESDPGPTELGSFILWLVEQSPQLEIFILQWDFGMVNAIKRGTTLLRLVQWARHPRIHVKFDSKHPLGASHHQKVMLVDDALAFVGGIDMTGDRWDTRAHHHKDKRRRRPFTRRLYKPWHDVTTASSGPVVDAIARMVRERWTVAGGTPKIPKLKAGRVLWPDDLPVQFEKVQVGLARTAPELDERPAVLEVEKLWLDQIAAARQHLYIESQYFASRAIVSALAKRLAEPDGPEIVVINPESAQGWLEPVAMDTARARLYAWLKRADHQNRFRMFHPYDEGGAPIYVHAKAMVVDDAMVKVGSSNINNRSLRLDTECDLVVLASGRARGQRERITWIRNDLLAEHLGTTPEAVAESLAQTGSLIATIEALNPEQGRHLRPYKPPKLNDLEKWLADNEVLDPEGPDEMFEALTRRGLTRGFIARFARK